MSRKIGVIENVLGRKGDRAVLTGVPMPGSGEAWAMGCRGDGIFGVVVDCPVHGPVRCLMPMCG